MRSSRCIATQLPENSNAVHPFPAPCSLQVQRQPLLSKYLSIKEGEQVLRRQFKSPAPGAPARSDVSPPVRCAVRGAAHADARMLLRDS